MTCTTLEFKPGQNVLLTDTVELPEGNWVAEALVKDSAGNEVGYFDIELVAPDIPTDPWGFLATFHAGDPEVLLMLLMTTTGPLGTCFWDVKFMDNGGGEPHNTLYSETMELILVPAITP